MLWIVLIVILVLLAGLIYFAVGQVPGKTLAVAQAAYREAIRQPMFWFLLLAAGFFMLVSLFLPYFTFGEDLKMVKLLQLDTILVPTLILTIFTASISISEEIEGRTAITLMSKPVSRRQFLLGKYTGILMAALLMTVVLTIFMGWTISFKIDWDKLRKPEDPLPAEIQAMQNTLSFLPGVITQGFRYVLLIFAEIQVLAPGVVMHFCQVMILTAVAVALATRLPMLVNLVICLSIFLVARLTHVLEVQAGENRLVLFVAQVFSTLLPGLNYYDLGAAIVSEREVPWGEYVAQAYLHGLIFTAIALLFGLILFEDRDLA